MTRISVIIPCYNHAHYLGEAIQSARAQTYREVEIIVVDDGSTDHTAQVAAAFGESVRYIYQANAGLAAARNAGIRASTGEYIALLDADDLWHPEFLQTLAAILDRDPALGAVYCGSRFINARGEVLPQVITRTVPANALHDALTGGEFFPPCAVLTRKSVFQRVGFFDETLSASEDWDMWLRVAAQFPFAGISNVLALYRMHGNNMSRDLTRMLDSQLQVACKHFGSMDGDPATWSLAQRRAFAGIYLWQASAYYQRNEPARGAEYARRAIVINPDVARALDPFYALSFADQPPGYVGDLDRVNLDQTARRLQEILDATKQPELRAHHRTAHGTALTWLKTLLGKRLLVALIQRKSQAV
ncbi:MAG: glycosyltransferase [Chloroflexi bacterium]|nr:glycosyltransferase [Chloroflexota bacterium]